MTLLEVLVVIIILSILSTIVVSNLDSLEHQTESTARQADIQSIVKALEIYLARTGTYPDTLDDLTRPFIVPGTGEEAGPLLRNINEDPTDNTPYQYIKMGNNRYVLENVAYPN